MRAIASGFEGSDSRVTPTVGAFVVLLLTAYLVEAPAKEIEGGRQARLPLR